MSDSKKVVAESQEIIGEGISKLLDCGVKEEMLKVLKNHRPNTPFSGFIQTIMFEAAKNTLLKTGDPELKEAVERIEKIQEGL